MMLDIDDVPCPTCRAPAGLACGYYSRATRESGVSAPRCRGRADAWFRRWQAQRISEYVHGKQAEDAK